MTSLRAWTPLLVLVALFVGGAYLVMLNLDASHGTARRCIPSLSPALAGQLSQSITQGSPITAQERREIPRPCRMPSR